MPRVSIDDLGDPRIAIYRDLKATNLTRSLDQFVVEGETLLDRLLASRFPIGSVLATEMREPRVAARVPADVPLYVVRDAMIDRLVGFNFHRGVLGCGHRRPWPGLEEILRGAGPTRTVVLCPRLDSPENLGAILRIGDAFGIDAVLVGARCPDPLSRRVLRVSMGASLRLPAISCESPEQAADRLRDAWGFELVAAVTGTGAEPLASAPRTDRLALILGREADGLPGEWVARCDRRVTIPMRPGADSLNVAVAAGILLYHFASPIL